MDNSDLPLIVAEMLIEIQNLKQRIALLENTFSDVRDDLHAIRDDAHETHGEVMDQSRCLNEMLAKVRAVLLERPQPAADPRPDLEVPANPAG